jgi:DNA-binding transcriptional regulator YiaG
MLQLAKNIRTIRKLSGITQPAFGKFFDCTKDMIINYELARAKPDDIFVSRLSKYTGIPEEDLMDTNLTEDNINVQKLYKVFRGETVSRGTRVPASEKTESDPNFRDMYIQALKDQIKDKSEQIEFLRKNFEISLNSLSQAAHVTVVGLRTLTWFQANVQAGGDEAKTAEVLAKLNSKAGEFAAVGSETGIPSGS